MIALAERPITEFSEEGIAFQEGIRLPEKAVLLRLTICAWGIDRKLRADQYHVDADKSMTRAGKKLIRCEELQAIYRRDEQARQWVASRSLPSSFKNGVYLQPLANLLDVDDYIRSYIEERQEILLPRFLSVYPDRVLQSRIDLGPLWDYRNYPRVPELQERFTVSHDYMEVTTAPGQLSHISAEIFAREQEKAAARWEKWMQNAMIMLRVQFADLVNHMEDRLQPGEIGPDGQPKCRQFGPQLVSNFQDWLSTWRARNIAGDTDLDRCVRRAEELLQGVTIHDLRSDEALREELQRSFAVIKEEVSALMIDRPSRVILLGDEEDDED